MPLVQSMNALDGKLQADQATCVDAGKQIGVSGKISARRGVCDMTTIQSRTFLDPEEFTQAVRAVNVEGYVTEKPGQFRADLTKVALEKLWLQAGIHRKQIANSPANKTAELAAA
jgi:hypothetical protein